MPIETFWKCTNVESDPPWELRFEEGKGYCAFSLKNFKKGDHILTEKPILTVKGYHPFDEDQVLEIVANISKLSEEDKEAFYSMANVFPEIINQGAGIFMTNSFDMTDSKLGPSCGKSI